MELKGTAIDKKFYLIKKGDGYVWYDSDPLKSKTLKEVDINKEVVSFFGNDKKKDETFPSPVNPIIVRIVGVVVERCRPFSAEDFESVKRLGHPSGSGQFVNAAGYEVTLRYDTREKEEWPLVGVIILENGDVVTRRYDTEGKCKSGNKRDDIVYQLSESEIEESNASKKGSEMNY